MTEKRTPLHDRHVALGARMVPFGGWTMPIQYAIGIVREHKAVREAAGLFDVSHMGELVVRGPRALEVVQKAITNDAGRLEIGQALYTVMCNPNGGIVDDCIVYRRGSDDFLFIVNASNIDKDRDWLVEVASGAETILDDSDATGLIAIQGPAARDIANGLADADLLALGRFRFVNCRVADVSCTVARTGYTGEDGFELACPAGDTARLWDALLDDGQSRGLVPIGLGARDTLRLEARLCLYGNDIDDTTTPYEADLGWVVKLEAKDFVGKQALVAEKQRGSSRKLVGFRVDGRGIPRHGYAIVDRSQGRDPEIGKVTSGTSGITVGGAIGLGYVPIGYAQVGGEIAVDCRGKDVAARIVAGPFYKRG